MKKYLLFLVLFFSAIYCYSQSFISWQKFLGGTRLDVMLSIQLTTDGGYICTGYSDSNDGDVTGNYGGPNSSDCWIVKLTNEGVIEWQKCFGYTWFDGA